MSLLRHHQRLASWVTLFTLVLALMAPTLSRAMAFVQGEVAPWGEVCSVGDLTMDEHQGNPTVPVAHVLDHCPFCSLQGAATALPPAPLAVVAVSALSHALPALFLQAPRTLHVWSAAQARAPPLSC